MTKLLQLETTFTYSSRCVAAQCFSTFRSVSSSCIAAGSNMTTELCTFGPYKIDPKQVFYSTGLSYAMVNLRPVHPGVKKYYSNRLNQMATDHGPGIRSYKRVFHPTHYMFKIESLSMVKVEKYESGVFEAGGHKWSLAFYPTGNKKVNENDYISLYLVIENTEKLLPCWEVNVSFRLFVFDQIRDNYLTIEDADGQVSRFRGTKTESGFAQFLSLKSFRDVSNGYLVGDACIFGAEVFVLQSSRKQHSICMIKSPSNNIMTWTLTKFSNLHDEKYYSQVFTVEESKWKLQVSPNGNGEAKDKYLSISLVWDEAVSQSQNIKVYAEFKIRLKSIARSYTLREYEGKSWFSSSRYSWGWDSFVLLVDLRDPYKGFIVNDYLTVEAEIIAISKVKSFP